MSRENDLANFKNTVTLGFSVTGSRELPVRLALALLSQDDAASRKMVKFIENAPHAEVEIVQSIYDSLSHDGHMLLVANRM